MSFTRHNLERNNLLFYEWDHLSPSRSQELWCHLRFDIIFIPCLFSWPTHHTLRHDLIILNVMSVRRAECAINIANWWGRHPKGGVRLNTGSSVRIKQEFGSCILWPGLVHGNVLYVKKINLFVPHPRVLSSYVHSKALQGMQKRTELRQCKSL